MFVVPISQCDTLKELAKLENEIKKLEYEQAKLSKKLQLLRTLKDDLQNKYTIERSKEVSQFDWTAKKYDWSEKANDALKSIFKLDSFRSKQLAAINATLSKQDTLLLMPTGGGKSLCYQLPAVLSKGVTVVVSPLLSLIEDQIIALNQLKITVSALNSGSNKEEQKKVYEYLNKEQGAPIKLIYVTPEWLAKSKRFMSALQKCYGRKALDRFAIDEVHCCSQWGHDFRPDYKFLGLLKSMFPDVPILGLTATATMKILIDVQNMLEIQGCTVLKASYNRPNLYYEVRQKPTTQQECVAYLKKMLTDEFKNKSGIIYTGTIKETQELTKALREENISVNCYHADLPPEVRRKIHKKWLEGKYQAVIATIAFGMGIDKPDVRFVIHHVLPKSIESFYQESGRAGRDGQKAKCIIMYRIQDVFRLSSMVSSKVGAENLYSMMEYCIDVSFCRRAIVASHFDELWDINHCNKMCDHCKYSKEIKDCDITKYCLQIYKIIDNATKADINLTVLKLLDAWYQTNSSLSKLKLNIPKPKFNRETAESIIAFLLIKSYLKEDKNYTAYAVNCYIKKGRIVPDDSGIMKKFPISSKIFDGVDDSARNKRKSVDNLKRSSSKVAKLDIIEIEDET